MSSTAKLAAIRDGHNMFEGLSNTTSYCALISGKNRLPLTTEVLIAEASKEDDHAHGVPGGGMGGMGEMDM